LLMSMPRVANGAWTLALVVVWWLTFTQTPPGNYVWRSWDGDTVHATVYPGEHFYFVLITFFAALPFFIWHVVRQRGISQLTGFKLAALASAGVAYIHLDLAALGIRGIVSVLGEGWLVPVLVGAVSSVVAFSAHLYFVDQQRMAASPFSINPEGNANASRPSDECGSG
jgi:hypothetical protein